jgi:ribosome-associated protein
MRQPPEDTPAPAFVPSYVPERPSKTRRKQQAHDLQALGEDLVELPPSRLVDLPMPEVLRDAIAQYRRTRSFEGKRRQLQYIGKQMRFADEAPLREAVAAYKLGSAKDTLKLHETERWRDELVADDAAATRWAADYPGSDLQRLRSLIRAARKDAAAAPEQRNGRGYRELFQFIKPWLSGDVSAADADERDNTDDAEPDDE